MGGQGATDPLKIKEGGNDPLKYNIATATSYSLYVVYVHGSRLAAV